MHKFRTAYDNCLSIKYFTKDKEKTISVETIEKVEKKLEYSEPIIEKLSTTEKENFEPIIEKKSESEPIIESIVLEEVISKIEINEVETTIKNSVQTKTEISKKKETEIIADMFENKRSLNEKSATTKKDLATKFKDNPIKDINSAIGLNDKFLFIRELFNNNSENFTKSIDKLNNFENLDQAMQFINNEFHWDAENPAFNKLLELVYRRYIS